jgi:hypothetical protein
MCPKTPSPRRSLPLGTATCRHPTLPNTGRHPTLPNTGCHPTLPNTGRHPTLPNTGHPLALPNTDHHLALPNTGRHLMLPNTGHALALPNTGHPLALPSTGHPLALPSTGRQPDAGALRPGCTPFGDSGEPVDLPAAMRVLRAMSRLVFIGASSPEIIIRQTILRMFAAHPHSAEIHASASPARR